MIRTHNVSLVLEEEGVDKGNLADGYLNRDVLTTQSYVLVQLYTQRVVCMFRQERQMKAVGDEKGKEERNGREGYKRGRGVEEGDRGERRPGEQGEEGRENQGEGRREGW